MNVLILVDTAVSVRLVTNNGRVILSATVAKPLTSHRLPMDNSSKSSGWAENAKSPSWNIAVDRVISFASMMENVGRVRIILSKYRARVLQIMLADIVNIKSNMSRRIAVWLDAMVMVNVITESNHRTRKVLTNIWIWIMRAITNFLTVPATKDMPGNIARKNTSNVGLAIIAFMELRV